MAAPIISPIKKDGRLRFSVDYRRLKKMTIKESYLLPLMDKSTESSRDIKLLATLDTYNGRWQVFIEPQDRHNT